MDREFTNFVLSYEGFEADQHAVDFYDASYAMLGFQRSLALTTHLILNNKIITQAPSLKGAQIYILPVQEGSLKFWARIVVVGTALYQLGTAPTDTPIGHLVSSVYDYVVHEVTGFHIDYDKSIGQLYEEYNKDKKEKLPQIKQSQLDSIAEKCEIAIRDMHRPIIASQTAQQAKISNYTNGEKRPSEALLNNTTYEYINFSENTTSAEEITGYVSSYNNNTFKGRLYVPELKRPIPFVLGDVARNSSTIGLITRSLHMNGQERMKTGSEVTCKAFKSLSHTGRIKSFTIVEVRRASN